jgi:hypothetical protein
MLKLLELLGFSNVRHGSVALSLFDALAQVDSVVSTIHLPWGEKIAVLKAQDDSENRVPCGVVATPEFSKSPLKKTTRALNAAR